VRAHFLLPLACYVLSMACPAAASGGGLRVRASLDEPLEATAVAPSPRRIRSSLDERPAIAALDLGKAELSIASPIRLTSAPRRLFRLTLDSESPPSDSRLIRLSLEDSGIVYGRLSRSSLNGRYVRTSLD
jgi:hypothetical protein